MAPFIRVVLPVISKIFHPLKSYVSQLQPREAYGSTHDFLLTLFNIFLL
jgi:hypothetical protein